MSLSPASAAYLALTIDHRAIMLSELVSNDDRTEDQFQALHRAFVVAAMDTDGNVVFQVTNDPEVAHLLPNPHTLYEIDPAPTSSLAAETAANALVACLVRVATQPLRSVVGDDQGRLPKMSLTESARVLIAMHLAGVWIPRANAAWNAAHARGYAVITMPAKG